MMSTSAASAAFGVEIYGGIASWGQTAAAITASLSNFNDGV